VWRDLPNLEQFEAERLDLGKHAEECGAVDDTGQDRVGAVWPRHHRRERAKYRGTELALDSDRVKDGWAHRVMVRAWRVSAHHLDRVMSRLSRGAGG
jgi:hypothetical protein